MPGFTRLFDGVICEVRYDLEPAPEGRSGPEIEVTSAVDLHGTDRLDDGIPYEEALSEAQDHYEEVKSHYLPGASL